MSITSVSHYDPQRDLPLERTYKTERGKITARKEQPFGFWFIHLERGQLPMKYRGAYTTLQQLEAAVQNYVAEKDLVLQESK